VVTVPRRRHDDGMAHLPGQFIHCQIPLRGHGPDPTRPDKIREPVGDPRAPDRTLSETRSRNVVGRILVRGVNAPLPPEEKKFLKI